MGLRAMRAEAPSRGGECLQQSPEEVGVRTSELLGEQGWCLWQCEVLNGEVIVVVDEADSPGVRATNRNLPEGHAVYKLRELFLLLKVNDSTIRLVHEAKKLGGAVVLEVEQLPEGKDPLR